MQRIDQSAWVPTGNGAMPPTKVQPMRPSQVHHTRSKPSKSLEKLCENPIKVAHKATAAATLQSLSINTSGLSYPLKLEVSTG
jgi:hypothetical protein